LSVTLESVHLLKGRRKTCYAIVSTNLRAWYGSQSYIYDAPLRECSPVRQNSDMRIYISVQSDPKLPPTAGAHRDEVEIEIQGPPAPNRMAAGRETRRPCVPLQ